MNPVTHFFVSWVVANSNSRLNRGERTAITLAGVAPDIDGLGLVAERLTIGGDSPLLWWTKYHHALAHNIGFGLLLAVVGFLAATRRWKTALLAFLSFHIHLLCDLVGSRGPGGEQWSIPYLLPFSDAWQLTWSGQWELNAWPNFVVTIAALMVTFYLAWKRGYSPLEMISKRADRVFVEALRNRFTYPRCHER